MPRAELTLSIGAMFYQRPFTVFSEGKDSTADCPVPIWGSALNAVELRSGNKSRKNPAFRRGRGVRRVAVLHLLHFHGTFSAKGKDIEHGVTAATAATAEKHADSLVILS